MYKIHVSYGNASSLIIWSRVDRLQSRWNGAGCSLLFQIQSSRLVIVLKCKKAVGGWAISYQLSAGAKLKQERGWACGDGCLIAPVLLGFQLRQSAASKLYNRAANSRSPVEGRIPINSGETTDDIILGGLGGGGGGAGWDATAWFPLSYMWAHRCMHEWESWAYVCNRMNRIYVINM